MVRVYYNIRKKKLSVQVKENGNWKLHEHADEISLTDVQFKVSEKGRQRVLKNKRKNVHAYILGNRVSNLEHTGALESIRYNPYELEKFHNGEKYIDSASAALIIGRKVLAVNSK